MSAVKYSQRTALLRMFIDRRGELIPNMLEDGVRHISLESNPIDPVFFDEIVLDGEYWIVTAIQCEEEYILRVKASQEEIDIYNTVKAYGELCAQYGVNR